LVLCKSARELITKAIFIGFRFYASLLNRLA